MKKNLHTLLLAALLPLPVCMGGCLQDETIDGPAPAGKGITISYSFDDLQTRGIPANADEKQLSDVQFVFYTYASGDGGDGTYVAHVRSAGPATPEGTGSLQLNIKGKLEPGKQYRTLIIANYDDHRDATQTFEDYIAANRTKTYARMREAMRSVCKDRMRTPLPLYGTLLGQDGQEALFTAPNPDAPGALASVSVRFSRAVCRIDLKNTVPGNLNIQWAKVCNYRDAGYFFHQDAPLGNTKQGTTAVPAGPDAGYTAVPPAEGLPALQELSGKLYAYPNIVANTVQNDLYTTCVLIAGYYTKTGDLENTTTLTYYRANVADPTLSQVLKRNYVYTLNITGVSGPGASSEQGGMEEQDRLLDFEVDNEWETGDGNTAQDPDGNFLTLSRTSVVLEAKAGETAIIRVAVKKGLGWEIDETALNKPGSAPAFSVEKIDEQSFLIKTLGDNKTDFTNTGQVTVKATGFTQNPEFPVQLTVSVTQLSTVSDVRMLVVEGVAGVNGQEGKLEKKAPGQGGVLPLLVLTGGGTGQWRATPDAALKALIADEWPKEGGNKGAIVIRFNPNLSGVTKRGTLRVERIWNDGVVDPDVPPVIVHFTQENNPNKISVIPAYGDGSDKLVIDGFQAEPGRANGVSKQVKFFVQLADPDKYTTKVRCTFRKDVDAFVDWGDKPSTREAIYTASTVGSEITTTDGTAMFGLYVFRTGPGDGGDDAPLEGQVMMTAVPKNPEVDQAQTISFSVKIESNCVQGDVLIKDDRNAYFTVTDRNCGTLAKSQGVAHNFTNQVGHPDNDVAYKIWKGGYYTFVEAPEACTQYGTENEDIYGIGTANQWLLPTKVQLDKMVLQMRFSKQRGYLLSETKTSEEGKEKYVGTWMPLAGTKDSPEFTTGYFWSQTIKDATFAYNCQVSAGSAINNSMGRRTNSYPVRCVRKN